jgi:hypothetical protein
MTDTNDSSGYTRGSNCDSYTTGVGETAITPKVATIGGTAGTTAHSISVPKAELNVEVISIIMDPTTSLTTWTESPTGTFAFSFEVVTNDTNIYVDDIAVCRLTSAGANRATLGGGAYNSTSGALSVGVNTFNLSMNSGTYAADDLILIAVAMSNLAAHSSADITVRLNQNITPNLIFTYEREGLFNKSATAEVLAAPDYSEYLHADFFETIQSTGYQTISATTACDAQGSWVPIETDGRIYRYPHDGDWGWCPGRKA